jgi:hypothetical protein
MVAVVHSFKRKYFRKTTAPRSSLRNALPYAATSFKQNTFLAFLSLKNQILTAEFEIPLQGL